MVIFVGALVRLIVLICLLKGIYCQLISLLFASGLINIYTTFKRIYMFVLNMNNNNKP